MSSQLPRQNHLQQLYPSTSRPPLAPSYPTSQRLRPASIPPSHTLPPLSSNEYLYTFPNEPASQQNQSPSSQYNPTNSGHPNQTGSLNYQPQSFSAAPRTFHPATNYGPQSWSPQTSTSQTYQLSNPAPAHHGLPSLLPMPSGVQQNTFYQQSPTTSAGSPFEPHHPPQPQQPHHQQHQQRQFQQSQIQQPQPPPPPPPPPQQPPTHVVGSQGRRGILPSAIGRPPAAVTDGTPGAQKAAPTPMKDSEGKFPCEHCNKNYLHAKHLKRHMLRHTGQRPYSCGLCDDTFSRSDILKRHFQKCSVRRGNPTGASHLTHSRASKKGKPNVVEQLSTPLANASASTSSSSAPSSQTQQQTPQGPTSTPTVQSPYDLQGLSNLGLGTVAYQEELQSFSARASRANSIKRSSNGMTINSRTGSGPSSVGGADSAFSYSTGQVTPDSLTTSGAATPYSIQHDSRLPFSPNGNYHANNTSGMDLSRPHSGPVHMTSNHPHIMGSAHGSRHELTDISHLFSANGHDDFNQQYSSHHDDTHHPIKSEPDFHYPYSNYISK